MTRIVLTRSCDLEFGQAEILEVQRVECRVRPLCSGRLDKCHNAVGRNGPRQDFREIKALCADLLHVDADAINREQGLVLHEHGDHVLICALR